MLKTGFKNLWLAQVFSQMGMNLLTFVLAIRVYELTHRNTVVSVLTLAFIIPAILFSTLSGTLVERWNKKTVLFLCNLSRAVAIIGFVFSSESIFWVYFLAFVISLISQFFVPAEAPLIPELVSKENLVSANSFFMMTIFVTMLAGGLLAGPLMNIFGLDKIFIILIIFFILASFFSLLIKSKKTQKTNQNLNFNLKKDLLTGLAYVRENNKVGLAMFLLVLSQTIIATFSAMLPGFADQVLKLKVTDASVYVLGPAVLGIVIGAALVSQIGKYFKPNAMINFGIISVIVSLIVLSFSKNLYLSQAFLLLLGFANAFVDVSANTILQRETDEGLRSRIYGILNTFAASAYVLPVIFSGTLADVLGVSNVFIIGAVLLFAIWFTKIRLAKLT